MNREKYVVLEISSWQGMSLGAEHYYGKLVGEKDDNYIKYELEKIMSKKDAERLSKKDDWKYKEGRGTSRFENEDEIREIAIKEWQKIFPNACALLEGRSISAEPMKCLKVKNENLKEKLNKIWEENEVISHISRNYNKIDILCDKYWKLLERACK